MNPGIGNEAMNAQIVNQALNIINDQEQEQAPKQEAPFDENDVLVTAEESLTTMLTKTLATA